MRAALLLTSVICALSIEAAPAANLQVAPTTIEVGDDGGSATIQISNRDERPVAVQVQAYAWNQTVEGEKLEKSDEIQVSPPFARVAPGERQTIRLMVPKSASGQKAYRLILSELPDPATLAAEKSAIRVLLQFSIPVFVGQNTSTAKLEWKAANQNGNTKISVHNAGGGRAKLADFDVIRENGQRQTVKLGASRYVLAGATREWTVPIPNLRPGENLRIDARDARGGAPSTAAVTVTKQ